MAEDSSSPNPGSRVDRHVVWVAVVGMAGLLILSLAALGMAFFLGRSQPLINITAGNNSEAGASGMQTTAALSPQPAQRPDQASNAPQGSRLSGQFPLNVRSLPNALDQSPERSDDGLPTRADTQSPPFYSTVSPVAKVYFRVRPMPDGPGGLKGPIPFRVHEWQPDAQGNVATVAASVPTGASDQEQFSYLPEVDYKTSSGKGKVLSVHLMNPRKVSVVNELRAPKGFQFLVAQIQVGNISKSPYQLDPGIFEIQDSDHVPYLLNPELLSSDFPQAPLDPGKSAMFTASFLVPADASLSSLASHEPGDGLVFSPLNPE
jgi:hypothetical protein